MHIDDYTGDAVSSQKVQKDWRKMLTDIGGYDNELIGVPAGGVIPMIEEIESLRKQVAELSAPSTEGKPEVPRQTAKQQYDGIMTDEYKNETSAIERLRFFLSFALNGQDWLDVEEFIDAVPATQPTQALADPQELSDVDLPPLPEPDRHFLCTKCGHSELTDMPLDRHPSCTKCTYTGFVLSDSRYTAEQTQQYALSAVRALLTGKRTS